jgi:hypothetical protein
VPPPINSAVITVSKTPTFNVFHMSSFLLQLNTKIKITIKKTPTAKSFEFAVKVSRSCCEHRLRFDEA